MCSNPSKVSDHWEMRMSRGRRLVLFPCPLEGHWSPMLHLASLLHANGFSITIIHTHFNSPETTDYQHFTFLPIVDGMPEYGCRDPMGLISAINVDCEAPLEEMLGNLVMPGKCEEPIACIISDALMHCTRVVAARLRVPSLILRTSSASSFVTCAAFPLLRDKGYLPIRDPQSETPVAELPPLRIKDLPHFGCDNVDNMHQIVSTMIDDSINSMGVISNSFDFLEPQSLDKIRRDFPFPHFPLGPLHKHSSFPSPSLFHQDHSCIPWLDQQAPQTVIFVSLGSLAVLTMPQMVETAWGLINSDHPFLWVIRTNHIKGMYNGSSEFNLPNEVEEAVKRRGKIVNWAPQQKVLAHPAVGCFWTHCGWNSVLEGVSEGVPMLCWPCFGDQRINARFVNYIWRVGLQMSTELKRKNIEEGIKEIMTSKEGKEMRERARMLKNNAELSIRKGGSSHEALKKLVNLVLSI